MVGEIAIQIYATPFSLKWDYLYIVWILPFLEMTWYVSVKVDLGVGC